MPAPCFESWDKMTPTDKGKHCAVCEKTVIDFTKSSHKEIDLFFKEHKEEKICGRMRTPKSKSAIHKAAVGIALVSLTLPNFAFDWEIQKTTHITSEMIQNNFGVVQGVISDEDTGEVLPFVKVSTTLNGQLFGCISDFDGRYKLQIPNIQNYKDTLVLTFSYLGYETVVRTTVMKENQITFENVLLKNSEERITIGIIVREPIIKKNENPFETKIEQPFRRNKNKRN